jgi:hypothetical protein
MIDLQFDDTEGFRYPATLDEDLSFEDLVDSQNQCISVQYNEYQKSTHLFYGWTSRYDTYTFLRPISRN